jgi:hypothetical protein
MDELASQQQYGKTNQASDPRECFLNTSRNLNHVVSRKRDRDIPDGSEQRTQDPNIRSKGLRVLSFGPQPSAKKAEASSGGGLALERAGIDSSVKP